MMKMEKLVSFIYGDIFEGVFPCKIYRGTKGMGWGMVGVHEDEERTKEDLSFICLKKGYLCLNKLKK